MDDQVAQMLNKHVLEKDGVVDTLYSYLWQKTDKEEGCKLYIPDTIIYRNRIVEGWYFTSRGGRDAGMIKRKAKTSITPHAIEESFIGKTPEEFDVVAVYIENPEGADGKPIPGATAAIEYLNQEQLRDLLHKRRKGMSAVLQRFLEPRGGHNSVIRAVWSPQVCMMEKRTNMRPLYDTRVDMLERVVTYDGPDHYSEVDILKGAVLPRAVQAICEDMANHVATVTKLRARIARMVLNFKVGNDGRLYLLTASSLRLEAPDILARVQALQVAAQPAVITPFASLDMVPSAYEISAAGQDGLGAGINGSGAGGTVGGSGYGLSLPLPPGGSSSIMTTVTGLNGQSSTIYMDAVGGISGIQGSMLSGYGMAPSIMNHSLSTSAILKGELQPVSKLGAVSLEADAKAVPVRLRQMHARRGNIMPEDNEEGESVAAAAAAAAGGGRIGHHGKDQSNGKPSHEKQKQKVRRSSVVSVHASGPAAAGHTNAEGHPIPSAVGARSLGPLERFHNRPLALIGSNGVPFDPDHQCPSCGSQFDASAPGTGGAGAAKGTGPMTVQCRIVTLHYEQLLKMLRVKPYIKPAPVAAAVDSKAPASDPATTTRNSGAETPAVDGTGTVLTENRAGILAQDPSPDGHDGAVAVDGDPAPAPPVAEAGPQKQHKWPDVPTIVSISAGIGVYGAFPPSNPGAQSARDSSSGFGASMATMMQSQSSALDHASLAFHTGKSSALLRSASNIPPHSVLVPEIPPTILNMAPALMPQEYRMLKHHEQFQSHSFRVCETCYIGYSAVRSADMAGNDLRNALIAVMGSEGMPAYHKIVHDAQAEREGRQSQQHAVERGSSSRLLGTNSSTPSFRKFSDRKPSKSRNMEQIRGIPSTKRMVGRYRSDLADGLHGDSKHEESILDVSAMESGFQHSDGEGFGPDLDGSQSMLMAGSNTASGLHHDAALHQSSIAEVIDDFVGSDLEGVPSIDMSGTPYQHQHRHQGEHHAQDGDSPLAGADQRQYMRDLTEDMTSSAQSSPTAAQKPVSTPRQKQHQRQQQAGLASAAARALKQGASQGGHTFKAFVPSARNPSEDGKPLAKATRPIGLAKSGSSSGRAAHGDDMASGHGRGRSISPAPSPSASGDEYELAGNHPSTSTYGYTTSGDEQEHDYGGYKSSAHSSDASRNGSKHASRGRSKAAASSTVGNGSKASAARSKPTLASPQQRPEFPPEAGMRAVTPNRAARPTSIAAAQLALSSPGAAADGDDNANVAQQAHDIGNDSVAGPADVVAPASGSLADVRDWLVHRINTKLQDHTMVKSHSAAKSPVLPNLVTGSPSGTGSSSGNSAYIYQAPRSSDDAVLSTTTKGGAASYSAQRGVATAMATLSFTPQSPLVPAHALVTHRVDSAPTSGHGTAGDIDGSLPLQQQYGDAIGVHASASFGSLPSDLHQRSVMSGTGPGSGAASKVKGHSPTPGHSRSRLDAHHGQHSGTATAAGGKSAPSPYTSKGVQLGPDQSSLRRKNISAEASKRIVARNANQKLLQAYGDECERRAGTGTLTASSLHGQAASPALDSTAPFVRIGGQTPSALSSPGDTNSPSRASPALSTTSVAPGILQLDGPDGSSTQIEASPMAGKSSSDPNAVPGVLHRTVLHVDDEASHTHQRASGESKEQDVDIDTEGKVSESQLNAAEAGPHASLHGHLRPLHHHLSVIHSQNEESQTSTHASRVQTDVEAVTGYESASPRAGATDDEEADEHLPMTSTSPVKVLPSTLSAASGVSAESAASRPVTSPHGNARSPSKTGSRSGARGGGLAASPFAPGGSRPASRIRSSSRGTAGGPGAPGRPGSRMQSRKGRHSPTAASKRPIKDDVIGAWSFDAAPPIAAGTGVIAIGHVAYAGRPYVAVVRRAHPQEVKGITWPKYMTPAELQAASERAAAGSGGQEAHGVDLDVENTPGPRPVSDVSAQPFAIYLRSMRSTRTVLQYLRLIDMRNSKNPALQRAAAVLDGAIAAGYPVQQQLQEVGAALPDANGWKGIFMHGLFSSMDCTRLCFASVRMQTSAEWEASRTSVTAGFELAAVRLANDPQYPALPIAADTTEELLQPVFSAKLFEVETGLVTALSDLTFARLVAHTLRSRDLHFLLIYAAKCRLAALAGYSGSLRDRDIISAWRPLMRSGSYPTAGTVARLIPGHWLGGRSSLDRARGFVADPRGPVEASELAKLAAAAQQNQQHGRDRSAGLSRNRNGSGNRPAPAGSDGGVSAGNSIMSHQQMASGHSFHGGPSGTMGVPETATAHQTGGRNSSTGPGLHQLGDIAAAVTGNFDARVGGITEVGGGVGGNGNGSTKMGAGTGFGLDPVMVKQALEFVDLAAVATAEEEFTESAEVLPLGTIARGVQILPDGNTIYTTLSVLNPNDLIAPPHMIADRQKWNSGTSPSKTGFDASNIGGQVSKEDSCFRIKTFATLTSTANDAWVRVGDLAKPLMNGDLLNYHVPTEPDPASTRALPTGFWPGNPLLEHAAFICSLDVPVQPGEMMIAARLVHADYVQRFVGTADAGSVHAALRTSLGPHSSVSVHGVYVLSLWTRMPEPGGRGHSRSQRSRPVTADKGSTLTNTQYGSRQSAAGPSPSARLPAFRVRCQYLRQPFTPFQPTQQEQQQRQGDAGASSAGNGAARKSSTMVVAEMQHWSKTGNLPSSSTLQRLVEQAESKHAAAAAAATELDRDGLTKLVEYPTVRMQQGDVEPVYEYDLDMVDLCRSDLNPFIERMDGPASKLTIDSAVSAYGKNQYGEEVLDWDGALGTLESASSGLPGHESAGGGASAGGAAASKSESNSGPASRHP